MQVLIDSDLVCYRVAASCEKRDKDGSIISLEPFDVAVDRANKLMQQIIDETSATSYRAFIGGPTNFRKAIDPAYKANRDNKPKPEHLQDLRAYLVTEWKAEVTENIEADDALGIAQRWYEGAWEEGEVEETIIASLDKDLLMIPGKHYSWPISGTTVKGEIWHKEGIFREVSELEGLRTFYASSLIGDTSDNIFGVDGIGPVKAGKLLAPCENEQEMYDVCKEAYNDLQRFYRNLKLLWIMREEDDYFDVCERGLEDYGN